jgi:hypothetical protein
MPNSTVFRSGFHRASGGNRKNMDFLVCSANVLTKIPQMHRSVESSALVGYGPANGEILTGDTQIVGPISVLDFRSPAMITAR